MIEKKIKALLGRRIKMLREERGLTQGMVSENADTITEKRWSDIERGRYSIGLTTLCRIAQGLGVSIQELFKFNETETNISQKIFFKDRILKLEKQAEKMSKEMNSLKKNISNLKKSVINIK